jgi:hypothetical protein
VIEFSHLISPSPFLCGLTTWDTARTIQESMT